MSEFTDSFHQLTVFVVSQLACFLQLKYRANDEKSLFPSHPTTMFVAVSNFLFYYFLHLMLLRSPTGRFAAVAQLLLVCSGYATMSTLAAPFFPAWATASLYLICVLLSTGELIDLFGNKFVIEDEEEEGETWKFRVYRRVGRLCGSVAKFFGHKPQPMLPIRIQH